MALLQMSDRIQHADPLLTVEDVAARFRVSKDWVLDHTSRSAPYCLSFPVVNRLH
jgi:hypothetical protein